jgi:hypothetical protein
MPKPFEFATLRSAGEGQIGGAWKLETRSDGMPGRLCQPVLSEFESWREVVMQRRAFAKRLKEN